MDWQGGRFRKGRPPFSWVDGGGAGTWLAEGEKSRHRERMTQEVLDDLVAQTVQHAPHEAAEVLSCRATEEALAVLDTLNPMVAQQILHELEPAVRDAWMAAAAPQRARQWVRNRAYPEDSVGWLMEAPVAIFRPHMTVAETIEAMRILTRKAFITYGYVTDSENRLTGVLVFRDLMLARSDQRLEEVMYRSIFWLTPEMELHEAMKAVLNRHIPVYPVCDEAGHLLGLVRGQMLFEARAFELSAQPGTMVGVHDEERLATPLRRSLRMRHPWLQFNLLTAFVAVAVDGAFSQTLDRIVLLAAFLPVVAGQSGNTGCQALAVCLRGLTLGELEKGQTRALFTKEAALGLLNGLLVGLVAGTGMFLYARGAGHPAALRLGSTVVVAMVLSCVVSGLSGAAIPLALRKLGFDPATASSIFLTTATDVVSMGTLLGIAALIVP